MHMCMSATIFQICLHMYKNMRWYLIPTTLNTLGYFWCLLLPFWLMLSPVSLFILSLLCLLVQCTQSSAHRVCPVPYQIHLLQQCCLAFLLTWLCMAILLYVVVSSCSWMMLLNGGAVGISDSSIFCYVEICCTLQEISHPLYLHWLPRLFPVTVTMKITPTHFWILP